MRRTLRVLLLAWLVSWSAGCQVGSPAQVPFTATQMTAERVVQHAAWLEVTLLSPRFNRIFYFRASDDCRALIVEGQPVEYRRTGGYGFVSRGEARCDVVGIGSLRQWRDSFGRPGSGIAAAKPRSRSGFEEFYRNDDVVLVRGRFLLAGRVGWPGGDDTIAVFSNTPECNAALAGGEATTEFKPNGSNALVLVHAGGGCAFRALIRPD